MRKSEMPEPVLAARAEFLRALTEAGWDANGFDALLGIGVNVEPEAVATYRGPVFLLDMQFWAEERRLALDVFTSATEVLLRLRLYPRNQRAVLEFVQAWQQMLDLENYAEFVEELVPLCDPLLLETDAGLLHVS
jgi:hypothetical protein